jgi:hypothetical protein
MSNRIVRARLKPLDEGRTKVPAKWPWPGKHGTCETHVNCPPKPESRPILTIGAAIEPSHNWTCGTDVIWFVYAVDGVEIQPDDRGRYPGVCRHQIEAGD